MVLGIIVPKGNNYTPIYYYMSAQYTETTDSARVSAVILDDDEKFTVTYTYQEFNVYYEVVMSDTVKSYKDWPPKWTDDEYNRELDSWPSHYDLGRQKYIPYTYDQVENMLMGDTKNTKKHGGLHQRKSTRSGYGQRRQSLRPGRERDKDLQILGAGGREQ